MWLRQLQGHFYELVDTNANGDWNEHGKYCPVKASRVEKKTSFGQHAHDQSKQCN